MTITYKIQIRTTSYFKTAQWHCPLKLPDTEQGIDMLNSNYSSLLMIVHTYYLFNKVTDLGRHFEIGLSQIDLIHINKDLRRLIYHFTDLFQNADN